MVHQIPHFINGQQVTGASKATRPIYNPALGEIIAEVGFADQTLCNQAVSAAGKAWHSWSETTATKRASILFKFRELLEKNRQELASIVTREHGKSLEDARGSVARAIEVVEFNCGLIAQLQSSFSANVANQIDTYTIRQPIGVCCGISPFNFPIMVPVWMMIPAIACGNTFILKPSEQDPSAPIRLMELLMDAGLPPGVVNCVQGDKTTVDCLITHPDVSAVTAVASTPVAEHIYQTAIAHGKRAHTFGGAKNHCVVMSDTNFEQAAKAIVGAAYGSAGERCMALSVAVVVGEETAEKLNHALIPMIEAIRVESGECATCDMGPLVSSAHRQKVLAAIDQGAKEGAELKIDGRNFKHPQFPQGFYLGPTLFDHVKETMRIYQNEIFGPVLCVMRVASFEEALDLINRNQYGNGTAIFTQDGYYAREFTHRVQVGMVGVNIPIPVPIASHPFGGWKRSVFGDSNMHGNESFQFYTKRKTITQRWPAHDDQGKASSGKEVHTFTIPTHS